MTDKVVKIGKKSNSFLINFVKKPFFVLALVVVPLGNLDFSAPVTPFVHTSVVSISDTVLTVNEEIRFQFDIPQTADDVVVRVSPYTEFSHKWVDGHTELVITPHESWSVASDYTISLGKRGTSGPQVLFHFSTENYPRILSYTSDHFDGDNFTVTPGASISYKLDRISDDVQFKALVQPYIDHTLELDREKGIITLTFNKSITSAQSVRVLFYAQLSTRAADDFFPIEAYNLNIFPLTKTEWAQDAEARVVQSATTITPQISEGKYIDINLTAHITTLFEDGVIVEQYINSPGADETPTPTGRFKVENKAENPLSQSYNVYLPNWLAFTPDGKYGLHGLIEWPVGHEEFPDGGKESTSSIDNAVSPGCVRHTDDVSHRVYEWAPVDTPVIIYK